VVDKQLIETNRRVVQQSEELKHVNEELKKLSIVDALTGLYSRRHFDECMESAAQISLCHVDTNSLTVIDIEHSKKVNDKYGHPGGDKRGRSSSAGWPWT
jgi:PleD family two-component response regulator